MQQRRGEESNAVSWVLAEGTALSAFQDLSIGVAVQQLDGEEYMEGIDRLSMHGLLQHHSIDLQDEESDLS